MDADAYIGRCRHRRLADGCTLCEDETEARRLFVSPCIACSTPGLCRDTDKCTTPKKGETWHILRPGAIACDTVTIAEMTAKTVMFEAKGPGLTPERLPLRMGLRFIERA